MSTMFLLEMSTVAEVGSLFVFSPKEDLTWVRSSVAV